MALARSRFSNDRGFTLIETLVAMGILVVGVVALAQLFAISTHSNVSSKSTTFTVILAQQKLEQLRGLTWGFDTLGLPESDLSTDLTAVSQQSGCPTPAGGGSGTGLSASPSGSLIANVAGYVDYLDGNGCVLGGGSSAPTGTVYIRRWSVEPLPTNPNNTLILQVLVTRRTNRTAAANAGNVVRLPEEARLMTVKTRKTR
jgi:prepilin-type N-terminal cleavage/methylation domain-containing protein